MLGHIGIGVALGSVSITRGRTRSSAGRVFRVVGAHVPAAKSAGFEARRVLDVYEPPDGYGCDWWQVVARRSQRVTGRTYIHTQHISWYAAVCAGESICYTPDSVIDLHRQREEDMAN